MKNKLFFSNSTCRLAVMLIVLISAFAGCSRHPKATSRESLEFIKQVYTACNTKDSKRLAVCELRLAELQSESKISEDESKSFRRVLDIASKGDWKSAQYKAFQFAKDQVR